MNPETPVPGEPADDRVAGPFADQVAEPADTGDSADLPEESPSDRQDYGWLGPRWDAPREAPDPIDRPLIRVLVGFGVAVVIALLGVPLAFIWSSVAPWLPAQVSGNELIYADPEGEQRAGAESWFILLMIGTGILVALIAWFALRRFRGSVMIGALAIGGTVAGWLTWRIGHTIGMSGVIAKERHATQGEIIQLPPALRIKSAGDIAYWHHLPYIGGVLLYLAVAAVITYTIATLITVSPALNRRRAAPMSPEPAEPEPTYDA